MDFINVLKNNGVYADGIHDDTAALQACIDTLKNGGTVYFPDGVYLISAALIFYSCQHLVFSDNAVIRRSGGEKPTRYLLASYSRREWSGYSGTHDVVISGGVFDGNEKVTEQSTLINTVHCRNIVIENCRFIHCSMWHCIEINSTVNAVVRGCVFDGNSYTRLCGELHNELIQLDLARDGSYGPVYNCDGTLIEFAPDDTVCRNVLITDCIFKCSGSPGIGHHGDCAHRDITVSNNIFDGLSGRDGRSRGFIFFRPLVSGVKVINNVFSAPDRGDSPSAGIICENPDANALICENNLFVGHFDDRTVTGDHGYYKG